MNKNSCRGLSLDANSLITANHLFSGAAFSPLRIQSHIARTTCVITLLLFCWTTNIMAQEGNPAFAIIPQPVSIEAGSGKFVLKNTSTIGILEKSKEARSVADYLVTKIKPATGFAPKVVEMSTANGAADIQLQLNKQPNAML